MALSLSSIHTRARNRNSFRHRKDIDWMAGCASKARPPMAGTPARIQRSQTIRGRYHDRYRVVSEAGTSVIRIEQLGRMALISPYVIDTRIQPLRALFVISYEPLPGAVPEKLEQPGVGAAIRLVYSISLGLASESQCNAARRTKHEEGSFLRFPPRVSGPLSIQSY